MAGQYDNSMRGALFPNEKRPGKRDADWRGHCEIDGKQYWVNVWENQTRDGAQYMSMTFAPKQAQDAQGGARNPPPRDSASRGEIRRGTAPTESFDDDDKIPF